MDLDQLAVMLIEQLEEYPDLDVDALWLVCGDDSGDDGGDNDANSHNN